jgi:hypothetical protein
LIDFGGFSSRFFSVCEFVLILDFISILSPTVQDFPADQIPTGIRICFCVSEHAAVCEVSSVVTELHWHRRITQRLQELTFDRPELDHLIDAFSGRNDRVGRVHFIETGES